MALCLGLMVEIQRKAAGPCGPQPGRFQTAFPTGAGACGFTSAASWTGVSCTALSQLPELVRITCGWAVAVPAECASALPECHSTVCVQPLLVVVLEIEGASEGVDVEEVERAALLCWVGGCSDSPPGSFLLLVLPPSSCDATSSVSDAWCAEQHFVVM